MTELRLRVEVYRCPVDGIAWCPNDGRNPRDYWRDRVPPEQIGGAHLFRCFMCGNLFLVGIEGISFGKCHRCREETYVVNYRGESTCGPCLAAQVLEVEKQSKLESLPAKKRPIWKFWK